MSKNTNNEIKTAMKAAQMGGSPKTESRSRSWLVAAQCRAVLRRDWAAERNYEARIIALDEAAAANTPDVDVKVAAAGCRLHSYCAMD